MYFISVELLAIYDWITLMRYKECKLSTINMFSSLNKLSYYPALAPHKGHLSTPATFVCPQGGSCVERFDCNQFHWNNFFQETEDEQVISYLAGEKSTATFSWNPAKGLEQNQQRMDKEEKVTSFTLVITFPTQVAV